jgi:nucleoid-associated protein YgaU
MNKDAKIGLGIILVAVLLSALLVGKALHRQPVKPVEIPDETSATLPAPEPEPAPEAASGQEEGPGESYDWTAPDALDRLLGLEGGGTDDASPSATEGSESSSTPAPTSEASPGISGTEPEGSPGTGLAGYAEDAPVPPTGGEEAEASPGPAVAVDDRVADVDDGVVVENTPAESEASDSGSEGRTAGLAGPTSATSGAPAAGPGLAGTPGLNPASTFSYTVQEGDSAWKLSKRFYGSGVHWKRIVTANPGVNFDRLRVGTQITVPASSGAESAVTAADTGRTRIAPLSAAVTPEASGGVRIHKIRSGDSFYRLAEEYLGSGMRYGEIAELNPGVDPAKLRIGQEIKIPAR